MNGHHKYDRLEKYGVILKRLSRDHLEMVRKWRNDPKISQYMEYREYISPEMQEEWFQKINNDYNYYYIIEYEGKDIGLINIRDIDHNSHTGEPGIFIWDDFYLNSNVSFMATFCLADFYFETLGIRKTIFHILKNNKRAINFNIFIGGKLSEGQDNVNNQEYTLEYKDYVTQRNKIVKYLI